LGPDLQQKVGAALAPAHLLFFHKPFADHLVDGRFCEPGRDGFSLPVPFTVIGNKGAISSDCESPPNNSTHLSILRIKYEKFTHRVKG
jgi:hypothetical protein